MSLLEALLLGPFRMNIWIALRTDGVPGTGAQNDPLDGTSLRAGATWWQRRAKWMWLRRPVPPLPFEQPW